MDFKYPVSAIVVICLALFAGIIGAAFVFSGNPATPGLDLGFDSYPKG
jgi:hypothetical protein